ncbi:MAG: hypothetical protein K6E51_04510 [Treponema sp.]|nr:hypothetical protein [Treponema sp.]
MKKHSKKHVVCLMAAMVCAALFLSCETTSSAANAEVALNYDESMTPENSCVIYFSFFLNTEAAFRQINPELDVDEQHFEYKKSDFQCWTVFKPCKPGSRYMLTKLKGSEGDMSGRFGGTIWDMDFDPSQQIFVIDVPKEPGVYCYGWIDGLAVARNASKGEVFQVPVPNDMTDWKAKTAVKRADKAFKKAYGGTPWYDAYLATKDKLLNARSK